MYNLSFIKVVGGQQVQMIESLVLMLLLVVKWYLLQGNGPGEVCEVPDDDDTWRDLLRDGPECGTDGVVDEDPDSDAEYSEECDGYGMDSGAALHRAMDAL
ncbi:hypothetical protein Tco_0833093 [Tanacetum coccineum]